MFGLNVKTVDESAAVLRAAQQGQSRGLSKAAYEIRKAAVALIETSADAAQPGRPIHTRRGAARRAIRYDVDRQALVAVIGPRASVLGEAGQVHEFGGTRFGQRYPARPFMGPALQQNLDKIPAGFAGEVGS